MVLDECPKLSNDKNKIKQIIKSYHLTGQKDQKMNLVKNQEKALFGIVQGGIYKI